MMAKPPGLERPTGIGETQVDDVEALIRVREEMPALVVDDAHLATGCCR